jgi:hypothetical protein
MNEIQKNSFGFLNQDDSDRDLTEGAVREIWDMVHTKDGVGSSPKLELIKPTRLLSTTLPSGTNKTIGVIEDKENNILYYFNWNSGNVDGIYAYDINDVSTPTITKIIEYDFGWSSSNVITGTVADGQIFFTNRIDPPMCVNVEFATIPSGQTNSDGLPGYDLTKDITQFYYVKPFPEKGIFANRIDDVNTINNRVSGNTYKFGYQNIYFDGGVSKISSWSQAVPADVVPSTALVQNAIEVLHTVDPNLDHLIKAIRFFYIKNNEGSVIQFEEMERPSSGWYISGNLNGRIELIFNSSEATTVVPTQDLVDQFENIPRRTNDIILRSNRMFLSKNLFGYDETGSATLNLSTVAATGSRSQAKHGGIYNAGLFYEDKFGWRSPIVKRASIQVPYLSTSFSNRRGIKCQILGLAPDWAVKWHIAYTEDNFYENYVEFPVYPMIVAGKARETQEDGVPFGDPVNTIPLNGWVYYSTNVSAAQIDANIITGIHLRFPSNLAIYPEKGMYGRFKDDAFIADPNLSSEFIVQDVVGDKIYIDLMGASAEDWVNNGRRFVNIEIYKKKETGDIIFQEVGISGPVLNDGTHNADRLWNGDQYYIDTSFYSRLSFLFLADPVLSNQYSSIFFGASMPYTAEVAVESPTPTSGGAVITDAGEIGFATIGQEEENLRQTYTLDYRKIANDRSKPHAEADIETIEAGDVILYSDPYIPNSRINGLFNVGLLSEFTLGVEDGDVTRLFSIGDRTIVAVHPHAVTSMYVGQGVLRTGDGEDIVSTTNEVIGYANRAKTRLGSTHPESFAERDGTLYWWDGSRGEVCRYAQNGVDALAIQNHFKSYFKVLADNRRMNADYRVFGMYNPEHEMYIIAFADASFGQISIPPVTIAYSARFGKFTLNSIVKPEHGHSIGDKLVMFKSGQAYQWNSTWGSLERQLLGDPYTPKVVFVANAMQDVVKLAMSFLIESDQPWDIKISTSTGAYSHTYIDDLTEDEKGKWYGETYRDESGSGAYPVTGAGGDRFSGDTIRGEVFQIELSRPDGEPATLNRFMLNYKALSGHFNGKV